MFANIILYLQILYHIIFANIIIIDGNNLIQNFSAVYPGKKH